MNVSLTPELERFITEQVESGRYRSKSEAVRAGVRLLEAQVRERETRIEVLRRAIDQGVVELDHGEGLEGEKVFEELLASIGISGQEP